LITRGLTHFVKTLFGVVVAAFIINTFLRVGDSRIIIEYIRTHNAFSIFLWLSGITFVVDIILAYRNFWKNNPKVNFWKIVHRNPDVAYLWFTSSSNWETVPYPLPSDYRRIFPESDWYGPYDLYVPMLKSRICIFGRSKTYQEAQNEFMQKFNNL
jgi:hypothetical protein